MSSTACVLKQAVVLTQSCLSTYMVSASWSLAANEVSGPSTSAWKKTPLWLLIMKLQYYEYIELCTGLTVVPISTTKAAQNHRFALLVSSDLELDSHHLFDQSQSLNTVLG